MEEKKRLKYYRYKIDNLLVVSRIVTVHDFTLKKNFASEGEEHDFWEMVYVAHGAFLATAGEESITLGEGEVVFHRPGEYHRHMADGIHTPRVFILSFECHSESMRFFEARRMRLTQPLQEQVYTILSEAGATFDLSAGNPRTRKMQLLPEPALGGTQMIKNRLEMFLVSLIREENSREGESGRFLRERSSRRQLADRITTNMRAHLGEALSVEELCEGIAYSRSYIFREFRLATGRTIADFYAGMRIEEAKRLIREGSQSFAEIADLLGFDTPNYFGKCFKKHTGETPRAYRQRMHGK